MWTLKSITNPRNEKEENLKTNFHALDKQTFDSRSPPCREKKKNADDKVNSFMSIALLTLEKAGGKRKTIERVIQHVCGTNHIANRAKQSWKRTDEVTTKRSKLKTRRTTEAGEKKKNWKTAKECVCVTRSGDEKNIYFSEEQKRMF